MGFKFACSFTHEEGVLCIMLISFDKMLNWFLVLFDNDNEQNEAEEGDMCVHYHYHGCHGAKEHLLV